MEYLVEPRRIGATMSNTFLDKGFLKDSPVLKERGISKQELERRLAILSEQGKKDRNVTKVNNATTAS